MPRGYPSLTNDQRNEIIKRVADRGERVLDLAREYGVGNKIVNALSLFSPYGLKDGLLVAIAPTTRFKLKTTV